MIGHEYPRFRPYRVFCSHNMNDGTFFVTYIDPRTGETDDKYLIFNPSDALDLCQDLTRQCREGLGTIRVLPYAWVVSLSWGPYDESQS